MADQVKNIDVITRKVGDKFLKLPPHHMLPTYYEDFILYDRALPRICQAISELDGYLKVIDVGANVGDTVSLITDKVQGDFLCIEGDPYYAQFLVENSKNIKGSKIYIEKSFCAENDNNIALKFIRENGTGRLNKEVFNDSSHNKRVRKLDTILYDNPYFNNANILKIDTDGFEIETLKGGLQFLKITKPVLYLEFAPHLYIENGQDPLEIVEILNHLGYYNMLFYDNYGYPVGICKKATKDDFIKYISKINNRDIFYLDILTYHHSKCINYEKIIDQELLSIFANIKPFLHSNLHSIKTELDNIKTKLDLVVSDLKIK